MLQEYLKPIIYGDDEEAKTVSRDVLYPYKLVHDVLVCFWPLLICDVQQLHMPRCRSSNLKPIYAIFD